MRKVRILRILIVFVVTGAILGFLVYDEWNKPQDGAFYDSRDFQNLFLPKNAQIHPVISISGNTALDNFCEAFSSSILKELKK